MSERRERLMDHEYDGIREYDNPTPGWWHMIFWASIVFSFFYFAFFHFSELAWSPEGQWHRARTGYFQKLFGELGELSPDEPTILSMMGDEKWMAVGGSVYAANCAQCHAQDGGGINGPNLTDDHYIAVRSLSDIYATVTEGRVSKGMPAWEKRLQLNERILVSAYVASLRGRPAASPRAAEGEAIPAWGASSEAASAGM